MIRAASCFQMPGRSWTREIRPFPIAPMLMRFPGDRLPSTDEGTMAGNPPAMDDKTTALPVVIMKSRRDEAMRRFPIAVTA
jgi:hypothetical protein